MLARKKAGNFQAVFGQWYTQKAAEAACCVKQFFYVLYYNGKIVMPSQIVELNVNVIVPSLMLDVTVCGVVAVVSINLMFTSDVL